MTQLLFYIRPSVYLAILFFLSFPEGSTLRFVTLATLDSRSALQKQGTRGLPSLMRALAIVIVVGEILLVLQK